MMTNCLRSDLGLTAWRIPLAVIAGVTVPPSVLDPISPFMRPSGSAGGS